MVSDASQMIIHKKPSEGHLGRRRQLGVHLLQAGLTPSSLTSKASFDGDLPKL